MPFDITDEIMDGKTNWYLAEILDIGYESSWYGDRSWLVGKRGLFIDGEEGMSKEYRAGHFHCIHDGKPLRFYCNAFKLHILKRKEDLGYD